jgi:hypothetical protein
MRLVYCLFLLLPACASHVVRCDGRLQPINQPEPPITATTPPAAGEVPPGEAT